MRGLILVILLTSISLINAQECIVFEYDAVGNRISRALDNDCNGDPGLKQNKEEIALSNQKSFKDSAVSAIDSILHDIIESPMNGNFNYDNNEIDNSAINTITFFPNPTQKDIFLRGLPENKIVKYSLYFTTTGKVLRENILLDSNIISLENLASGSYRLKLLIDQESFDFVIIKY